MIDFWIAAALLVLVALAFLLLPVLRERRRQAEEDRTALNVALYQERLAELERQYQAGMLGEKQYQAGRAEASRELLADTENAEAPVTGHVLGRRVPLVLAALLPLLGLGLYLHWGASDALSLSREMQTPPASVEEFISRLERTLEIQPEFAEGWYLLGRSYMASERPADAAVALERAVALAGREPELLGQLAQARFFAGDRKWNDELQALADEALAGNPQEVTTLGLLGIAAFEDGRYAEAVGFWQSLTDALPPQDPTRAAIASGIAAARQRAAQAGTPLPEAEQQVSSAQVRVRVALAPELSDKVQPGDSVFVFARAVSGPPMPLAVRRLTVADLPAEVALDDSDAMLPELKLSAHPKILLMARISRAGDAMRGEWTGRSDELASDSGEIQQLLIDQPDGQ